MGPGGMDDGAVRAQTRPGARTTVNESTVNRAVTRGGAGAWVMGEESRVTRQSKARKKIG